MHSHHFSCRRDLKPLGGAAMRLELQLLYLFSHEYFLSEIFPSGTGFRLARQREHPALPPAPCRRVSAPTAPSKHLLPSAGRFRPERVRRSPPGAGAFLLGLLPGEPFRARDEKSSP